MNNKLQTLTTVVCESAISTQGYILRRGSDGVILQADEFPLRIIPSIVDIESWAEPIVMPAERPLILDLVAELVGS